MMDLWNDPPSAINNAPVVTEAPVTKPVYKQPYDPNYVKKPFDPTKYKKPYDPNFKSQFKPKAKKVPGLPELYKPFALFANSSIPLEIKELAIKIAELLELHGCTLRTDTTSEIDAIFQEKITRKEIYLPWKAFKDLDSPNYFSTDISKEVAKKYFAKFDDMKDTVKAFLSRNTRTVLGQELKNNISFMIVWTADGAESKSEKSVRTGLTAHPMSIALDIKVPVFNLQRPDVLDRLTKYLES